MNTEKIRYLKTALELGSFAAAADRFGMTASGINRQITALEEELGCALLRRSRTGVQPSKGSEAVLKRLFSVLDAEDSVTGEIAAAKGMLAGSLTIGSYFSVATGFMPGFLREFRNRYPAIGLQVWESTDDELLEGLESGRLDCAIMRKRTDRSLEWYPLFSTEMAVWLPADHPLTEKEKISAEDLRNESVVFPQRNRETDVSAFYAKHRLDPKVCVHTSNPYTTFAMVSAGLGICVDLRIFSQTLFPDAQLRSFDPPETVELGIALLSVGAASPALLRFVAEIRQYAEESYC